jgi:hypothetical protein
MAQAYRTEVLEGGGLGTAKSIADRIFKRTLMLDTRVSLKYHPGPERPKKQGSKVSGI